MNKEQILNTIKSLSHSQGFYSRLLRDIENDENILNELEKQKFNDSLDLVLFLEQ